MKAVQAFWARLHGPGHFPKHRFCSSNLRLHVAFSNRIWVSTRVRERQKRRLRVADGSRIRRTKISAFENIRIRVATAWIDVKKSCEYANFQFGILRQNKGLWEPLRCVLIKIAVFEGSAAPIYVTWINFLFSETRRYNQFPDFLLDASVYCQQWANQSNDNEEFEKSEISCFHILFPTLVADYPLPPPQHPPFLKDWIVDKANHRFAEGHNFPHTAQSGHEKVAD